MAAIKEPPIKSNPWAGMGVTEGESEYWGIDPTQPVIDREAMAQQGMLRLEEPFAPQEKPPEFQLEAPKIPKIYTDQTYAQAAKAFEGMEGLDLTYADAPTEGEGVRRTEEFRPVWEKKQEAIEKYQMEELEAGVMQTYEEQRHAKVLEKAKQGINEAFLIKKYPLGNEKRVLELDRIRNNPDSAPEKIRAAEQELDGYSREDPSRALGGIAGVVVAAIAAGMGAYGAAMTGSKNSALDTINKAIDRDIAAQRQRFRRKASDYYNKRDMFAKMMRQSGDKVTAAMETKAHLYTNTANYMNLLGERAKDINVKQKILDLGMEYRNKAIEANNQIEVHRYNAERGKLMDITQLKGKQAALNLQARKANLEAQTKLRSMSGWTGLSKKHQEKQILLAGQLPEGVIPLGGNKYLSDTGVKEVQKLMVDHVPLMRAISGLEKLRADYNVKDYLTPEFLSDKKKAMRQLEGSIQSALKGAAFLNMGAAWTEQEKKLLDKVIGGDPSDMGFILDAYKRLHSEYDQRANDKLKAFNAKFAPTKSGILRGRLKESSY